MNTISNKTASYIGNTRTDREICHPSKECQIFGSKTSATVRRI